MQALPKIEWEGRYFDGKSAASQPVTITVMRRGLGIQKADGSTFWWAYDQTRQTQGSYAGEQVRLEMGEDIPEALVVDNSAFLTAIHHIDPDVRFHNPRHRSMRVKLTLLAAVGIIAVGAALYLWGIPALADAAATRLPVSWEERLGREVMNHLAPEDRRDTNPARARTLDRIASTLTSSAPQSPYTIRIFVVKDSIVNAFAAPGGYIVVYHGLLQKTETPEELAGVLAHEIQHVLQRHATKALFRELSTQALIAALTGDTEGMSYLLETAGTIGGLRYRRRDEESADREGMKMIQAAGIDPSGMVDFLSTLKKEGMDLPRGLAYLSTHPPTDDRIEKLKRLAARTHYTPITLLPNGAWTDVRKGWDADPSK